MGNPSYRPSSGGGGGRWREHFNQQLDKLYYAPVDQGNWGPKKPGSSVFGAAESIPSQVRNASLPPPIVVATSGGGIQVKWDQPGVEFSVFIYSDNSLEYLLRNSSGTESGELRRIDQINDFVDRYFH
jgi:hypothetical protein